MTNAWALSTLWVGLALVATLLASWVQGLDRTVRNRGRTVWMHPAEQIIHMADERQASLIVMGKPSHTILQRRMIGSNSERVLHCAHCPVMMVHWG